MSDRLLDLSQNPLVRNAVGRLGLPIPLPVRLRRQDGPTVERFLEDRRVLVDGDGDLVEAIAEVLARAGARSVARSPVVAKRMSPAAEAHARPVEQVGAAPSEDEGDVDALVFDATSLSDQGDLDRVHELLHPWISKLTGSGRILILTRPPEQSASAGQAAARTALGGLVRSVAKEMGGRGVTCNLVQVENDADARLAAVLRFFLSPASAFVTAQPLRVRAVARWNGDDPWLRPLEGKVALVTGAARGIGAATAKALAEDGARVVCLDRPEDDEPLARTAREVGGSPLRVDVAADDAPARIAGELAERFGGVDVVVHNAGVTRDRMLARMPLDRWRQVLDVNLSAVLRITDALIEGPLHDDGRIVSLASISGIAGNTGQTNYAASKAGVMGLTRWWAEELAPRGITVNAVAPGFIETRMTAAVPFAVREAGRRLSALGQGGQPEDVARAIAFLASPGAAGVTGQVLRICGGALLGA
jgi:3-oxoacyl-[acyl-carrier protein] reductase